MTLLAVSELTKRFGDLVAVDDAAFDVEDGEFISILGPSGSGKSTVLRMIAGFEEPTDGEIVLAGENVVGSPPFERDVNMVFQNLALFPHLTVAENIGYGLKQQGVPAPERKERTADMLEMVELEGYGDRQPNELSGGEQQRVALARALVNEPALVLFDEPLSSLDRKLRQHMQRELQRIQTETDTTFLYVTHDQEVALAVSDRLIVLDDGAVQQIGAVESLYEEPASRFVADFIGDVNVIEATVTDVTDAAVTVDPGTGPVNVTDPVGTFETGDTVDVCIRPYRISVEPRDADDAPVDAEVTGPATVFSSNGTVGSRNYQGSTSVVDVATEAFGTVEAEVRGRGFEPNDEVTVHWSGADSYLFRRTGERPGED
jgi:spermidine/putrescine transport system ATP-binding protein